MIFVTIVGDRELRFRTDAEKQIHKKVKAKAKAQPSLADLQCVGVQGDQPDAKGRANV